MIKDFSFGIIPIKIHQDRNQYLLIHHQKGHWAFPKGHAEDGEGALEAAVRELREETGLQVDIRQDTPTFLEDYWFTSPEGEKVYKTNTFFVGLIHNPEVIIQEEEVKDFAWVSFDEAMKKITFPASQKLLKQVHQYLNKHPLSA